MNIYKDKDFDMGIEIIKTEEQSEWYKKITELWYGFEKVFAERDRYKEQLNILAEGAAAHACPANGQFIMCDKFLNAGCKCPEAIDADYRKNCWLEAAERIAEARGELNQ